MLSGQNNTSAFHEIEINMEGLVLEDEPETNLECSIKDINTKSVYLLEEDIKLQDTHEQKKIIMRFFRGLTEKSIPDNSCPTFDIGTNLTSQTMAIEAQPMEQHLAGNYHSRLTMTTTVGSNEDQACNLPVSSTPSGRNSGTPPTTYIVEKECLWSDNYSNNIHRPKKLKLQPADDVFRTKDHVYADRLRKNYILERPRVRGYRCCSPICSCRLRVDDPEGSPTKRAMKARKQSVST